MMKLLLKPNLPLKIFHKINSWKIINESADGWFNILIYGIYEALIISI
jgi:hypothetical protein